MSEVQNPSVPLYRRLPPRPLTGAERRAFERIADALIPPRGSLTSPSTYAEFAGLLDRALAARGQAFDDAVASAMRFASTDPDALRDALRSYSARSAARFHLISSIVAGAYLMIPAVRRQIGYPGQRRHPAQFDEAANQIMDGILDPVIARGSIYVPTAEQAGAGGR